MTTYTKTLRVLSGIATFVILVIVTLASISASTTTFTHTAPIPAHAQGGMTQTEALEWLATGCTVPAQWDKGEIPAAAVVRSAATGMISRVAFDKAYKLSRSGSVWILAFCTTEKR